MRNRALLYAAEVKKCCQIQSCLNVLPVGIHMAPYSQLYAESTNRSQPVLMPEHIPSGIIAPMTTPFSRSGDLLPKSLRRRV
jgi:hypothetical protein